MPRSNRIYLPGHIWHITHRCHKKEFLFKLKKDRLNWLKHLFEAKKRYDLKVLNYMVTSNHIHLLVQSDDNDSISKSMQYVAGRTGQDYNRRKSRKGAFWEDRYHATAVEKGDYLARCMIYIDMNMVRAGVVTHPSEWDECGFKEVLTPKPRYSLINRSVLLSALEFDSQDELKKVYPSWLNETLANDRAKFEERWSNSIAIGSEVFVDGVRKELGLSEMQHTKDELDEGYSLREPQSEYGVDNLYNWI